MKITKTEPMSRGRLVDVGVPGWIASHIEHVGAVASTRGRLASLLSAIDYDSRDHEVTVEYEKSFAAHAEFVYLYHYALGVYGDDNRRDKQA